MIRRFALTATLITGAGLLVSAAQGKDDKAVKPPAAPKARAQKVPVARPPAAGRVAGGRAAQPQPDNHPGEQMLDRLLRMSPEQRQNALDRLNLPPQRRQNIERRINEIQKLPPDMQSRARARLEMLNSLPQPRQNQVRRSINQYAGALPERKTLMNQALQKISSLPDEDRRAYMNTEEFRNRFSPTEQQIISNLSEIY